MFVYFCRIKCIFLFYDLDDWDFNMQLPYGCDHWAKVSVEHLCELDFQVVF